MGEGREKLEGSEIDWKGEDGRFRKRLERKEDGRLRKRLEGRSWKVKKGDGREKLQGLGREWNWRSWKI